LRGRLNQEYVDGLYNGQTLNYRAAGVNRLSLGIQSFSDAKLKALGRVHDRAQACAAAEAAAELFETFNLDLMYALPEQTLPELRADLTQALAFSPPHLSCYHLTLEPNTLFARFPPPAPEAAPPTTTAPPDKQRRWRDDLHLAHTIANKVDSLTLARFDAGNFTVETKNKRNGLEQKISLLL